MLAFLRHEGDGRTHEKWRVLVAGKEIAATPRADLGGLVPDRVGVPCRGALEDHGGHQGPSLRWILERISSIMACRHRSDSLSYSNDPATDAITPI